MRQNYGLSDETFQILIGKESLIADEFGCDESYIFGIKNQKNPDPYPKFRRLFRAAVRAGANAQLWLNDLSGIYAKAQMATTAMHELSTNLLEKIKADGESTSRIVDAIADSHLTKTECHAILSALAKNTETNKRLEQLTLRRLGELSEEEK